MEVTDTQIANTMQRFIDCNYALCNTEKGFDCLNTLLIFYSDLGVSMPNEFEGYTLENYKKLWEKDINKSKEVLGRFLLSLGMEVGYSERIRGDLLLYKTAALNLFPAIYLGNGNGFYIFQEGGRVCPIKFFKPQFFQSRRLINNV